MNTKSIGIFSITLSIYILNSCNIENSNYKELLSQKTITNFNYLSDIARQSSDGKITVNDVRKLEQHEKS
ncbi:MAG: hypothetical protein C4617_05310 [Candidatus Liberibacter europaeus]|uniref:Uncharacterized protein n=1 Tax=Candidatus Liberibacter europaeus TaxID=744859 RepID=A0A2T4VWI1_9HYPH|nr:hypothetical protein [Candidatus Liberibacter europaeus]PTL86127.1 MAG: hypothetical protein C4617_05310 [Candidatus Liberibacter europaeus]